jgi:hypothetical protein
MVNVNMTATPHGKVLLFLGTFIIERMVLVGTEAFWLSKNLP